MRDRYDRRREPSFFARHPALSVFGILGCLCFLSCSGCCGFATYWSRTTTAEEARRKAEAEAKTAKEKEAADAKAARERKEAQEELFHADRLWVAGQKEDAVKLYRKALDRKAPGVPGEHLLAAIHGRLIERELLEGDRIAARRLAEKAIEEGIDPAPETKEGRDVVRSVRAQRAVLAEAERQRKEEARLRKEEQDRIVTARNEEERRKRQEEAMEARAKAKALEKWYQGGTLHQAKMRQWRAADRRDKVATAADLVVSILGAEGVTVRLTPGDEPALRKAAEGFADALDQANRGGDLDDETVAFVAATIYVLGKLQYQRDG